MGRTYLIFFIFLLLVSCDNIKEVRYYRLAKEPSENPALDKIPLKEKNDFTWDAPDYWSPLDNNPYSLASYDIGSSPNGLRSTISITKFSGDAGGILANVNRWRGQLNLEPHTLKQINEDSMEGSSYLGTFTAYKIINPSLREKPLDMATNLNEFKEELDAMGMMQKNNEYLCAILPYGNNTIFIKLATNSRDFEKMFLDFCSSFRPIAID